MAKLPIISDFLLSERLFKSRIWWIIKIHDFSHSKGPPLQIAEDFYLHCTVIVNAEFLYRLLLNRCKNVFDAI